MESAIRTLAMNYGDKDAAISKLEQLIIKYSNAPQTKKVQERTLLYKEELSFIKNINH